MSKRFWPSYKRSSKFARVVLAPKYTVLHSMLKIRLGAVPDTEVKTPQPTPPYVVQPVPTWSVRRSSHCGMIGMLNVAEGSGQAFVNRVLLLTNCRLPLEEMLAVVKLWPYKVYGNGSVMGVVPSST